MTCFLGESSGSDRIRNWINGWFSIRHFRYKKGERPNPSPLLDRPSAESEHEVDDGEAHRDEYHANEHEDDRALETGCSMICVASLSQLTNQLIIQEPAAFSHYHVTPSDNCFSSPMVFSRLPVSLRDVFVRGLRKRLEFLELCRHLGSD